MSGRFEEGLTAGEIARVVNQYIGVNGGYLGDFTYRSHADFYAEYCEVYDVDGGDRVIVTPLLITRIPHPMVGTRIVRRFRSI